MISAFQQYVHHSDGTITVQGLPGVRLDTIQEQGRVTGRDIERELGLPHFYEDWEVIAKPQGLSRRRVWFIAADESETRLQGHIRLQPRKITRPPACYLEFGHRGFVVGLVDTFLLAYTECRDQLKYLGIELPASVEGDCLIAQAQLFDSPLADKAWEAIQRGIFTHVCPLVLRKEEEPLGTGQLVEVSLTTDDYPGCPEARVLKTWTF